MRGGKRENAGRKPGVPNKATAEKRAEIEASGLTPLDYMLSVLRDENKPADMRMDAAKAAAPYVHAKLASVEHKGEDGGPLQIVVRQFTLAGG
jgi:hypothetical protein